MKIEVVTADGVLRRAAGLRALEAGITYPIEDGARAFTIDHGEAYHPFFSAMGEARFLVGLEDERVVATLACVLKEGAVAGRALRTAYLADLKIAPELRGRGAGRAILARALGHATLRDRSLLAWDLAYGAAMRGARGDVMRALRGAGPAAFARSIAELDLYFEPPEKLAALDVASAPRAPRARDALDLSPRRVALWETTRGTKDLRIVGGGAWPLVHLPAGPAAWGPSHGAYVALAARAIVEGRGDESAVEGAIACFALDSRLGREAAWLARSGVVPGATCTVWGLFRPLARPRFDYVHLATSEI